MSEHLMKAKEVADTLGFCQHTVYRMSIRGDLNRVKIGPRSFRWKRDEIERIAKEGLPDKVAV